MRPIRLHILVIAGCFASYWSGTVQAQSWLREAIPPEQRTHDFGTVARAANTEHRFYIKNPLDRDLHIRSVRASCGCTTPIVETEWIKPGETGSILARFNTGTFTGQRGATLTVSFDQPYYAELQLRVSGYIRSDVVLFPGEANFGNVPEGQSKSIDLQLDYAGRNDWKIVEFQSPVDFVETGFKEVSRRGGRVKYRLTVILKESAPAGFHMNQLLLRTDDRNLKTIPVRFIANVEPSIQVSPKLLALGRVKPGEPVRQRLVIKGQEPFTVVGITSDVCDVSFEPAADSKNVHLVQITLRPRSSGKPQDAGAMAGQLLIRTTLRDEPIAVPVTFEMERGSDTVAIDRPF